MRSSTFIAALDNTDVNAYTQMQRSFGWAPCVAVAALNSDSALVLYADGLAATVRAVDIGTVPNVVEVDTVAVCNSGVRCLSVSTLAGGGSAFVVGHAEGVTLGRVDLLESSTAPASTSVAGSVKLSAASRPTCVHVDAANLRFAHGTADGRVFVRPLEPATEGTPPRAERLMAGGQGPHTSFVSFWAFSPEVIVAAG